MSVSLSPKPPAEERGSKIGRKVSTRQVGQGAVASRTLGRRKSSAGRRKSVSEVSIPVNSPSNRRRRSSVTEQWQKGQVKTSTLVAATGMFEGKTNMSEMEEFEEECRKANAARELAKKTFDEGGVEGLAAEAARLKAEVMASLYPGAAPAPVAAQGPAPVGCRNIGTDGRCDNTVLTTDAAEDAAEVRFLAAERATMDQAALKRKEDELARKQEAQAEANRAAAAAVKGAAAKKQSELARKKDEALRAAAASAEAAEAKKVQDTANAKAAAEFEAELAAAHDAANQENAAAAALEAQLAVAKASATAATARLRRLEAQVGRANTIERKRELENRRKQSQTGSQTGRLVCTKSELAEDGALKLPNISKSGARDAHREAAYGGNDRFNPTKKPKQPSRPKQALRPNRPSRPKRPY